VTETVRIHGIAAGGDGVASLSDGRVVFVPRSAPGDLLVLRDVAPTRRFARARIAQVVEPSPERVEPRCPHYQGDECGSCQLQHLLPQAQRSARGRIVGEALRRIGRVQVEDPEVEPGDTDWNYRAKITLAVQGGRGRSLRMGYHRLGRPNQVFDMVQCLLARPELTALWIGIREHRSLLPFNVDRLVLRVDRTGGRHLIVKTTGSATWTRAVDLGRSLSAAGSVFLWWHPEGGAARVLFGSGDPYPATVFEQVHPAVGDRVRSFAVGELGGLSLRHVWDLYAGIGETTALIRHADPHAAIESVEVDRRAVALAEAGGPSDRITRHAGRVEALLERLQPADAAIVNPPRTGLAPEMIRHLTEPPAGRAPGRVVYVSCDPATLARDVARLAPAYRLVRLRAFDAFPQTAHVETVATLDRG
jgi:23S rRNA (uracil1939-C5)-methyltransferase